MKMMIIVALLLSFFSSAQAIDCNEEITVPYAGWTKSYDLLENGYCFGGYWIPGLITNSFYWMPPPQHFYTRAIYQAEGVIEQTAALKGFDGTEDYIALMSPITAGWHAFIRMPDTEVWIPVRVVDVVKREHYDPHVVSMQSGLELSYPLAERLGVIDWVNEDGSRYPYGVDVCIADFNPEEVCAGESISFMEWYWENARFVGDMTRSEASD